MAACSTGAKTDNLANLEITNPTLPDILVATIKIPVVTTLVTAVTPIDTPMPPELPDIFTTELLQGSSNPTPYILDTCKYLQARWDPKNSAPGTVVMPIMFHSIVNNEKTLPTDYAIHRKYLEAILTRAYELGFNTITTRQLVDFLETNAP
ncbi:MAG: hypothetical protein U1B80_06905, partial [Anaerolineaceae bacterium]|nr:hypothetical protein [Anaerolineaceae bacterium]